MRFVVNKQKNMCTERKRQHTKYPASDRNRTKEKTKGLEPNRPVVIRTAHGSKSSIARRALSRRRPARCPIDKFTPLQSEAGWRFIVFAQSLC